MSFFENNNLSEENSVVLIESSQNSCVVEFLSKLHGLKWWLFGYNPCSVSFVESSNLELSP